ncbi:MAG TPA: hypothetical protein VJK25_02580 [Patescibacteria group bacterium]|nr:hypothetical protein [Patescibacteria group bacterium]
MSEQGTERQKEIFEKLKEYLADRGYEYFGYDGPNDDNYIFGEPIRCYIKYISTRATKRPRESLLVLVKKNERNENMEGIKIYNPDFWGQGSASVFCKT